MNDTIQQYDLHVEWNSVGLKAPRVHYAQSYFHTGTSHVCIHLIAYTIRPSKGWSDLQWLSFISNDLNTNPHAAFLHTESIQPNKQEPPGFSDSIIFKYGDHTQKFKTI